LGVSYEPFTPLPLVSFEGGSHIVVCNLAAFNQKEGDGNAKSDRFAVRDFYAGRFIGMLGGLARCRA
jgi:hypothetical protein